MISSFGTAVFGAIYAIVLNHDRTDVGQGPGVGVRSFNPQTINSAVLAQLKSTAAGCSSHQVHRAVTHSVRCLPGGGAHRLVAFLLSSCPEVELRKTVQTVDVGEVNGSPGPGRRCRRSVALTRLSAGEPGRALQTLLRGRHDLPPRAVWLLYRLADQPAAWSTTWRSG